MSKIKLHSGLILGTISLGLLMVSINVLHIQSASASALTGQTAEAATYAEGSIINDENSCVSAAAKNITYSTTDHNYYSSERAQVNATKDAYYAFNWVSPIGDPDQPFQPVDQGSSTQVTMQLNQLQAICALLVENNHNSDHITDQSAIVNSSNFPNDRAPNPDVPDIDAASESGDFYNIVGNSISPAGTGTLHLDSSGGTSINVSRNVDSRYWLNSTPPYFTFTPTKPWSSTTPITVTIDIKGYRKYHEGPALVYECINAGQNYFLGSGETNGTYGDDTYIRYATPSDYNTFYAHCPTQTLVVPFTVVVKPTLSVAPASSSQGYCSGSVTGVASDQSSPQTELRIDIYEDEDATDGGYPADRQYTTHTTVINGIDHSFDIPLAAIEAGNTGPDGTGPNKTGSTDWSTHTFYVYAIGVNTQGQEDGSGDDTTASFTVGPCAEVSCSAVTALGTIDEGGSSTFYLTATVNDVSTGPPSVVPSFTDVELTGPDGVVATVGPTVAYGSYIPPDTIQSQPITFTPSVTGTYSVHYTWVDSGHTANNAATSCGQSGTSAYEPYFTTEGGDTAAGASFVGTSGASSCSENSTAGIASWNSNTTGTSGYYGAGSQMASLATGTIASFVTGQKPLVNITAGHPPTGLSQTNPYDLAFANTSAGSSGIYGGAVGSLPCISDYVDSVPTSSPDVDGLNLSNTASGQYYHNGSLIVNGAEIPAGTVIKVRVNGDVYVNGNITYDDSEGPFKYPRLDIYATGNIYIDHSVTALHGLYVAQGTTAADTGNFVTCAIAGVETTDYTTCHNQLTVYGSVAAQSMHLDRSFGNLSDTTGPAEKFVYSPEFWLATPDCNAGITESNCSDVDAISNLPPVL